MPKQSEKVQTLSLKQFTAFEEVTFDFSPGINVLIGANGTGKSHVMKIIYSLLKAAESLHEYKSAIELSPKLRGVFRLNTTDNLIRFVVRDNPVHKNTVVLDYGNIKLNLSIRRGSDGKVKSAIKHNVNVTDVPTPPSLIYLPAQEFLSINEGFISAYNRRELPYDETYYDLALALNALPLRGDELVEIQEAVTFLRKILTGEGEDKEQDREQKEVLTRQNDRFLFHLPEGDLDVHLVAEGYRKIATLYYLLKNGSLAKDSILFWDEPEANLNPKLIVEVGKVLQTLARAGMQIFVATHDYLLSHRLSLLAEYPSDKSADIRFFALHRPDRVSGVLVESGQTLADIEHNPILEEFAAHYDYETSLFHNS
ncbi:AAA family ATPase [Desulfobacterales bacterium HSG2]|nr:AAA family ATPase [Desulfobacterales bacterium HSG2]